MTKYSSNMIDKNMIYDLYVNKRVTLIFTTLVLYNKLQTLKYLKFESCILIFFLYFDLKLSM